MLLLRSCAQRLPSVLRPQSVKAGLVLGSIRPFSNCPPLRSTDMDQVNTSKRLAHLRDLMKNHKLDVYGLLAAPCYRKSFGT